MLSIGDAKAVTIRKIVELFGKEYVRENLKNALVAYPESDEMIYEFFCGFESNFETNKWTVFARISVNRKTHDIQFLDYKLPNGERMKNPIKPVVYS